jgi:UDP-glucose 4-epimerase
MGPDESLVLITGATGAVGPSVVRQALEHGYRVRTLSRHQPPTGLFPDSVESCVGDIASVDDRRRALEGVDRVLHLAAMLHITDPAAQARADYETVNVDATAALGADALAAGVSRIVFFSSIAVYGETGGRVATEETPPAPTTSYGRSKLAAERAILALTRAGQPAAVVLRLAAVYGPRLKGNYRALVRHLAAGRPLPILPGANRRTLVFDDDVGAAAVLAAGHVTAPGRVYNVTDGSIHRFSQITTAICEALGRTTPSLGVPAEFARAAVTAARPLLRGPLARVPAMVDKYVEDAAVDGSRIQRELGFRPAVGLSEGWRRTVQSVRCEQP